MWQGSQKMWLFLTAITIYITQSLIEEETVKYFASQGKLNAR